MQVLTHHVLEIRVEHAGVCCGVATDGPRVQNDLVRLEAQFVDGVLHHHVDRVALLLRKRLSLRTDDVTCHRNNTASVRE